MLDKNELKEIIEFSRNTNKLILEKNFKEVILKIETYTEEIKNKSISKEFIIYFLRDVGWMRDDLDATQKGKFEFEFEAKEVVTRINRLILIIISKIESLPDNERGNLFEEANRLFEPIFTEIPEKKEGFAYFGHIQPDMNYYSEIYSKMIETLEKEGIILRKFKEWKRKYEEEFAKKIGLTKNGN